MHVCGARINSVSHSISLFLSFISFFVSFTTLLLTKLSILCMFLKISIHLYAYLLTYLQYMLNSSVSLSSCVLRCRVLLICLISEVKKKNSQASFHFVLFFTTDTQPMSCFLHFHMIFNGPGPETNELTDPKLILRCLSVCNKENERIGAQLHIFCLCCMCQFVYLLCFFHYKQQQLLQSVVV